MRTHRNTLHTKIFYSYLCVNWLVRVFCLWICVNWEKYNVGDLKTMKYIQHAEWTERSHKRFNIGRNSCVHEKKLICSALTCFFFCSIEGNERYVSATRWMLKKVLTRTYKTINTKSPNPHNSFMSNLSVFLNFWYKFKVVLSDLYKWMVINSLEYMLYMSQLKLNSSPQSCLVWIWNNTQQMHDN